MALPAALQAQFNYTTQNGTITITGYTGPGGLVTIPATIDGLPVTSIRERTFQDKTSVTSVTIPDSVTTIGGRAFSGCSSLVGVYFEGNSPQIDSDLFSGSPAVIVYYRAGVTSLGPTFEGRPTALWVPPPNYSEWVLSTALPTQYPQASAEPDDPDQDGMANGEEMLAWTDPISKASLLTLEQLPRPSDLIQNDQTAVEVWEHVLYIRTVPGKSYGVHIADGLGSPWRTESVVSATTTQKRWVFDKPENQAFYRVILAQ